MSLRTYPERVIACPDVSAKRATFEEWSNHERFLRSIRSYASVHKNWLANTKRFVKLHVVVGFSLRGKRSPPPRLLSTAMTKDVTPVTPTVGISVYLMTRRVLRWLIRSQVSGESYDNCTKKGRLKNQPNVRFA